MSQVGVYPLRKVDGAAKFDAAWEEAQGIGVRKLAGLAWERAIYGTPRGVGYQGERVEEERRYNDRLLMFTLRHHDPHTYGARAGTDRVPPHVRRKLRAEWEREKAEELRGMYGGIGPAEFLRRKLEVMGSGCKTHKKTGFGKLRDLSAEPHSAICIAQSCGHS